MSTLVRAISAWCVALLVVFLGCQQEKPQQTPASSPTVEPSDAPARAEALKGERLAEFLTAHQQGLGHMERYEYGQAVKAFRKTVELDPSSTPANINLAIALLNDSGEQAEDAKRARGPTESASNFGEALEILDQVVASEPENLHARYCRGLILEFQGELERAHADFKAVVEGDPSDPYAWLKFGITLPDPKRPGFTASIESAPELVEIYTKALERNPNVTLTLFKLQEAYNWLAVSKRDPEAKKKRDELSQLWRKYNSKESPTAVGDFSTTSYGETGKYATVINPFPSTSKRAETLVPPRFEVPRPLNVTLPPGDRWAQAADFASDDATSPLAVVGRARERFGAVIAHFDANGDGRLDLYLPASIKTESGVRDALLVNEGDGAFRDASAEYGLAADRASLGVAAADFDADRRIDLVLTGVGSIHVLRNLDGKRFEDVTSELGELDTPAVALTARWLDLDQDGDLDLFVVNHTSLEHAGRAFGSTQPPGTANSVYRNDGTPPRIPNLTETNFAPAAVAPADLAVSEGLTRKWTNWTGPEVAALRDPAHAHTAIAAADFDNDRDIDVLIAGDGTPPTLALNDRLGRFRAQMLPDLDPKGQLNGLAVLDLDHDGLPDVVFILPRARLAAFTTRVVANPEGAPGFAFAFWPTDAKAWRAALTFDLDLDGWEDLLGVPTPLEGEPPAPIWSRNEGSRLAETSLPLGPDGTEPLLGLDLVDVLADPLPELVLLREGQPPHVARNLGNGNHWLALELTGRWKFGFDFMRTNPHGLGTRVSLGGSGLEVPGATALAGSGLGQSVGPLYLGMRTVPMATLLRLRWPDGVMQAELNVPANQVLSLAEQNRKTGSCPVLFTFDGHRYVCIGDFLGGGGLGYLVAPGLYGEPDRDEAISIRGDQLAPVGNRYKISITEPMDEVAYLDMLTLDVVDRPPGIETAPDERFAPGGNRPTGELLAWREVVDPVRATDLEGRDVTEALRAFDRRTVDGLSKLRGWIGYTEEHGIVLDFGDRLAGLTPGDRVVLCLAGWVEYPYSQTNYAAATAGVALQPPVLERRGDHGSWEVIEPDPGYPAGLPRLTTLDVTGKLTGPRCALRLRTNMECYYDQVFVARIESDPGVRVTSIPVAKAVLGYRGYTREASPDGRLPLMYEYDFVDPAPLAHLRGTLTRYGDVAAMLRADDDQLCVVGPGDEVLVEFDANAVAALPTGWTRAYILRTTGYCKDADPFTAGSDTVGPLPWRGMPAHYPFGKEHERLIDPAYAEYLRTYQTRGVEP